MWLLLGGIMLYAVGIVFILALCNAAQRSRSDLPGRRSACYPPEFDVERHVAPDPIVSEEFYGLAEPRVATETESTLVR